MSAVEDELSDENVPLLHSRRVSILDQPIGSFRGPNTLQNFASSFTRAQSFAAHKLDADLHKKRSFFASGYGDNEEFVQDELYDPNLMVASPHGERLSALLGDLPPSSLRAGAYSYNEVFYNDDIPTRPHIPAPLPPSRGLPSQSFSSSRSVLSFATEASQFALKQVSDAKGNSVTVVAGRSTAPQTVLNSVNVLIGMGLLALPVGLLRGGWVLGLPLLVACCLATYWSAGLLSRSLDTDATLMTYADLAAATYGSAAKGLVSVVFSVDLLASGVALVLLFSDSVYALAGDEFWTKTRLKLVAFVVLTPFTFVPLPVLSIFSLFGILATVSITALVFACGLMKPEAPGSLLAVMPTNLWPESASQLLIGLGILMAPFGGHAIFPNLKSDMRHPHKFTKTLRSTYAITLATDCSMAVIGFFMFGALCSNEVTSNLLTTSGYPSWVYPLISGLICIVPLAKTPLNAKPIISTIDSLFGLDLVMEVESGFKNAFKNISRFAIRIGVNALFVGFSIIFPEFDKIIGILGSSICFIICIILPCLFYLKLCKSSIGSLERVRINIVVIISSVLAILCTYATIAY